jgi:hypothetical protein
VKSGKKWRLALGASACFFLDFVIFFESSMMQVLAAAMP